MLVVDADWYIKRVTEIGADWALKPIKGRVSREIRDYEPRECVSRMGGMLVELGGRVSEVGV